MGYGLDSSGSEQGPWRAFMNTVTNLSVLYNVDKFLSI
jgi:hypothetical protein